MLKYPIGSGSGKEAIAMEEQINIQIYHPIKQVHVPVDEVVVVKMVDG
jgi:hypothetical protein